MRQNQHSKSFYNAGLAILVGCSLAFDAINVIGAIKYAKNHPIRKDISVSIAPVIKENNCMVNYFFENNLFESNTTQRFNSGNNLYLPVELFNGIQYSDVYHK
jgi:hypothetical protein